MHYHSYGGRAADTLVHAAAAEAGPAAGSPPRGGHGGVCRDARHGMLLIAAAAAVAVLAALALRLESVVSTLLAAYLGYVADLGFVTLALSPFRAVTPGGLALAELALLALAALAWWARGRSQPAAEGGPAAGTAAAAARTRVSAARPPYEQ